MEPLENEQSLYYQTIAKEFFKHRGSPFLLSPKDLYIIAEWEKMNIPLGVVLEGIRNSFEPGNRTSRGRGRVLTIAYCQPAVLRAFALYRERKAGSGAGVVPRGDKRQKARQEVREFLVRLPEGVRYLEEIYKEAEKLLSSPEVGEETMDRLEEKVEESLWKHCPEKDKAVVAMNLEGPSCVRKKDLDEMVRIKAIKTLREKYRIPHLSFYYY